MTTSGDSTSTGNQSPNTSDEETQTPTGSESDSFVVATSEHSQETQPPTGSDSDSSVVATSEDSQTNTDDTEGRIPRYSTDFNHIKKLGHGGFGRVFQCLHKLDEQIYAVKMIPIEGQDADLAIREVKIMSQLHHPCLVRYHQAWRDYNLDVVYNNTDDDESAEGLDEIFSKPTAFDEFVCIQMECCSMTLLERLHPDQIYVYVKANAINLLRQLLEGVRYLHDQGIVHRDLSTKNVFLDDHGNVKIGDFGLAVFVNPDNDEDGEKVDGYYAAPETKISKKVDIYSLGVIWFELCHPFETVTERDKVLRPLGEEGKLPDTWTEENSTEASLVRLLISPEASHRPSAEEILQHHMPSL